MDTSSRGNVTSLSALLDQSKKFVSQIQRSDVSLPTLQLGLDQIEAQSRRLAQQQQQQQYGNAQYTNGTSSTGMQVDSDDLSRAQYMLAQANVDTSQLTRTLNALQPSSAFVPLQAHKDNDVHFMIRQAQESALVACIEESRRQTLQDFHNQLREQTLRDWERQKSELFDELARHHPALVADGSTSNDSFSNNIASSSNLAGSSSMNRPRRSSVSKKSSNGPSYEAYMSPASTSASPLQPGSELQMHNKMMKYDQAIGRITHARKQGTPIAAVSVLADAANQATSNVAVESRALNLAETWSLLKTIVGEHDIQASTGDFGAQSIVQGQYAEAYSKVGADADLPIAVDLRRKIAHGAKTYLEEQCVLFMSRVYLPVKWDIQVHTFGRFMKHVESTLARNPQQANLGGVPSVSNKIRAYVNLVYGSSGSLEMINKEPLWARIFFLARAGYLNEALNLATASENAAAITASEPNFITYFKSYCLPANGLRLPKSVRDRFMTEYNQRIRYLTAQSGSGTSADPFKLALYKLIGRAELSKRNIAVATEKTEHWLWLQLALVREDLDGSSAANERYTLRDFANVLRKFGEAHWDPKGNRPGLYFQILLMSGQFERAIAFLYSRQSHRIDAVHFAIALAYYGLIKASEQSQSSELDLIHASTDAAGYEVTHINFSRLLHRYYWSFAKADPTHALQYICCISLTFSGCKISTQQEQKAVIADFTKELVIESKAFGALLGELDAQGQKTSGAIQSSCSLLGVENGQQFVQNLVKTVVSSVDSASRFNDSILLYNIAEDYNSVVDVICTELGNSLSSPSSAFNANNGQQQDALSVAKSVLEHYDATNIRLDRRKRDTLQKLIKIKSAFGLSDTGKLDEALISIESVSIIPLSAGADVVPIIKAAEDFKELDESIVRNFDAILVTTMNILYGIHQQLKESPYGDSSRQSKMAEIKRKARTLMTYAGVRLPILQLMISWKPSLIAYGSQMLRYRLSAETYSLLSARDVYIH